MKYIYTILLSTICLISYSQTEQIDDSSDEMSSSSYFGISLGLSVPGGGSMEAVNSGANLGFINFGYRFNETWGATANLASSGHSLDGEDLTFAFAYWGIGPMYTTKISENTYWDIKPQLALGMLGKYGDPNGSIIDGVEWNGSGFIIGNSFVFGNTKGLRFSIDIDYLSGNWDDISLGGVSFDTSAAGLDDSMSKFSLGLGLRYNF